MIQLLVLLFALFLRKLPPASTACFSKACGDLTVACPFWLEEAGQQPCGSPSFQLRCNGNHTPSPQALLAHSVFGKYQRAIFFLAENSSFVAVDHNLLVPTPGGCPRWWFDVSASIGLGPYTISRKNRELLVLYNCTKRPQGTPPGFLRMPCVNESFVHLGGEYGSQRELGSVPLPPACSLSVVPVLGLPYGEEYVGSMRRGFLLEWTVPSDNCPRCMASGGQCRYRNDGTGFSCNCSGAVYPDECGEFRKSIALSIYHHILGWCLIEGPNQLAVVDVADFMPLNSYTRSHNKTASQKTEVHQMDLNRAVLH
ncbi:hypothetical protein ACQ4PT_047916 [Festuca glaucescens]